MSRFIMLEDTRDRAFALILIESGLEISGSIKIRTRTIPGEHDRLPPPPKGWSATWWPSDLGSSGDDGAGFRVWSRK